MLLGQKVYVKETILPYLRHRSACYFPWCLMCHHVVLHVLAIFWCPPLCPDTHTSTYRLQNNNMGFARFCVLILGRTKAPRPNERSVRRKRISLSPHVPLAGLAVLVGRINLPCADNHTVSAPGERCHDGLVEYVAFTVQVGFGKL